jgi:hypothetical protein
MVVAVQSSKKRADSSAWAAQARASRRARMSFMVLVGFVIVDGRLGEREYVIRMTREGRGEAL